ncbi:hypothetical protein NO1_1992 [Candidatus Termititenax aidoneus]|uniref:Uncharacterized protein n=1 Tax=Termititenax aidoneus TaxID=2218524 RepID=A0A388TE58_TERA1|nr:hypothetical protein NO1_1992 [Candidatus Termititenax aidoneus]
MASDYSSVYDGIASKEPLSAEKVTLALNQMEKVANKVSKAEWDANASGERTSDSKYPSCMAVNSAVEAISSKLTSSAGTLTSSIAAMDTAAEKAANRIKTTATADADKWEANKTNDNKYPSCAVVNSVVSAVSVGAERVANRIDTTEWDNNYDDDNLYPTCGAVTHAVNSAVGGVNAAISTVNGNITTVGGKISTVESTLSALSGAAEKTVNKVSSITTENKISTTLYPNCAAAQAAITTAVNDLKIANARSTYVSSGSTHNEYPTAKAVYDAFWNRFNLL